MLTCLRYIANTGQGAMQKNFSTAFLNSLKPTNKPYEVADTGVKGLIVRVQPSGVRSYIVRYRRDKRATIGPVGPVTLERARALAMSALQAAYKGESDKAIRELVRPKAPEDPLTLEEFLDKQYETWITLRLKSGAKEVARIRSRFSDFLKTPLSSITPWSLEKWRVARSELGLSPQTINRDLATLKAALNRAVEWGALKETPMKAVKPAKVENDRRVRYLDPDEETRLRHALEEREAWIRTQRQNANEWRNARDRDPLPEFDDQGYVDHLSPMILLSLNTGLRQGELFDLLWEDINRPGRRLIVRAAAAKGGRSRHIPLNTEAIEVIDAWSRTSDQKGRLFKGRLGDRFDNVKKSWGMILEKASIHDFRWHDLRHTFASKLVMAGVDLNTVRELLGHADLKMTLRYAHLSPGHLAEAVDRLSPAKAEEKKIIVEAL